MLTALCPNVASSVEEVNRWMREDFGPEGLKTLIRDELADIASKAGGFESLRPSSSPESSYKVKRMGRMDLSPGMDNE